MNDCQSLLHILFISVFFFFELTNGQQAYCHRGYSRTVRKVITEKLLPHYHALNVKLPETCPLNLNRDVYFLQEEKILEESANRVKCDICGKVFIGLPYLDLHFDNRHPEYVVKDSKAVCFADFCEIARCDIISGMRTADFWDISLCLEDDMRELQDQCRRISDQCIPDGLTLKQKKQIIDHMDSGLCNYLTCKTYWEGPRDTNSNSVVMYSVLTVFMLIFMTIYYCVAYHYFYTDTFIDSYDYDRAVRPKSTYTPHTLQEKSQKRLRIYKDRQKVLEEIDQEDIQM